MKVWAIDCVQNCYSYINEPVDRIFYKLMHHKLHEAHFHCCSTYLLHECLLIFYLIIYHDQLFNNRILFTVK
jgi:hypothetical protein